RDSQSHGGGVARRQAQFSLRLPRESAPGVRARRGRRPRRMRTVRAGDDGHRVRVLQALRPGQARRRWRRGRARPIALPARACFELTAAMAIVGSSVAVGKIAVARLPVFLLSGLRFAVASAILITLVALLQRPLPRLTGRDLAVLTLQSFAGIFAFNVLLLYGLGYTSAAEGGIVTSTTPAVAATLAVIVLGERWSAGRPVGVALVVVGILAPNLAGGGVGPPRRRPGTPGAWPLVGNLLLFGAVVGEAVFVVCSRVAAQRLPPLVVATGISALGLVMFLPIAIVEMRAFPLSRLAPIDWTIVAYYGVL